LELVWVRNEFNLLTDVSQVAVLVAVAALKSQDLLKEHAPSAVGLTAWDTRVPCATIEVIVAALVGRDTVPFARHVVLIVDV
jgi:hypothetical protein